MRSSLPSSFIRIGDSIQPLSFKDLKGSIIEIYVYHDSIFRVRHFPPGGKHVSTDLNCQDLVPADTINLSVAGLVYSLQSDQIKLEISLENSDFVIFWTKETVFLKDLPFRAYEYDLNGGVSHYVQHMADDLHYGMGERSSPLELNGRRFRLEALDCMGYNAERTDPLYKIIPYYLTVNSKTKEAYGIFYNSYCSGIIDFGSEIDALWGKYRVYKTEHGILDYFVFYGPQISDCVSKFSKLIGKPAMVPKFALGYLASSMGYAESEFAQEMIQKFPQLCAKWDIPCDLLHLSSGYTVDADTGARNVFTWNSKRFNDPKSMFQSLSESGIKTVANVKPWLLMGHPDYQKVKLGRGFIWDNDSNAPSLTRLWSSGAGQTATGSYIDFSSDFGRDYWKNGIKELLDMGVTGIWNDNNEFSISDDNHVFSLNGGSDVGGSGRIRQTVLMASASYEAMQENSPYTRPFLISRAGAAGSHRYASQTWSGDNYTSWHTLKHNIPMGLNGKKTELNIAGLSLLPGYGHDIGGFAGPRPSPELFVRWVQNGIFHPRFCIHSWKNEGITEPWMYPEVLPIIRDAIHLRYKLLPYLYTLSYESHQYGRPIIRPLFYEFQNDDNAYNVSFDFMLGPYLLVSSVTESGITEKKVYLPGTCKDYWYNYWNDEIYHGGQSIIVKVPMSQHGAVFARHGSMIPMGKVMKYVGAEPDDERIIHLFPMICQKSDSFTTSTTLYEDDGLTNSGQHFLIKLTMISNFDSIKLRLDQENNGFTPAFKKLTVRLPSTEKRLFTCTNSEMVEENGDYNISILNH